MNKINHQILCILLDYIYIAVKMFAKFTFTLLRKGKILNNPVLTQLVYCLYN